jgi:hypothetical protein
MGVDQYGSLMTRGCEVTDTMESIGKEAEQEELRRREEEEREEEARRQRLEEERRKLVEEEKQREEERERQRTRKRAEPVWNEVSVGGVAAPAVNSLSDLEAKRAEALRRVEAINKRLKQTQL